MRELLSIMARLRAEQGCPWDQEQTFASVAPYTIEEAYEVADAAERGDMLELKDELGDLLFQVVFHAQMASESGAFDFDAVAAAICDKLLRRHPHVFANKGLLTAAEQSVALAHALRAENNSDIRIQLELSRALDNLGYINHINGDPSAAVDALRESESIMTRLFAAQPNNPEVADLLLRTWDFLAEALNGIQNMGGADAVRQSAVDLRKKLKR